jgi:hypothetical protein
MSVPCCNGCLGCAIVAQARLWLGTPPPPPPIQFPCGKSRKEVGHDFETNAYRHGLTRKLDQRVCVREMHGDVARGTCIEYTLRGGSMHGIESAGSRRLTNT